MSDCIPVVVPPLVCLFFLLSPVLNKMNDFPLYNRVKNLNTHRLINGFPLIFMKNNNLNMRYIIMEFDKTTLLS